MAKNKLAPVENTGSDNWPQNVADAQTTTKSAKRAKEISVEVNDTGVRIDFGPCGVITLGMDDLTSDMINKVAMHGIRSKLVDSYALGKDATLQEKYDAAYNMRQHLIEGKWTTRQPGQHEGTGGLLIRAIVALSDGRKSYDDVRIALDSKSAEEIKALRKVPSVAVKMAELKAAQSEVGDSTLSELIA